MLSAINSNQSFKGKCTVLLPDCTDLNRLFERVKIKNLNFKLTFVEPDLLKGRELAADEFTYIGKEKIKGTPMARFIFKDSYEYDFQLTALLKSIFGDNRVLGLRK